MSEESDRLKKVAVENIYALLKRCYNEGRCFIPRDLLSDVYGTKKGDRLDFPFWTALYDPKGDDKINLLLQIMLGAGEKLLSKDRELVDDFYTELLIVNPSDVYFWSNVSQKYGVSSQDTLSKQDAILIWKFIRFKLRNFEGSGHIKETLGEYEFAEVLDDGQASHTVAMAKELKKHSFRKIVEIFGPALMTRGCRKSFMKSSDAS